MRENEKDQKGTDESPSDLSRRDFIALSSAVVLGSLTSSASGHELSVIETDVSSTRLTAPAMLRLFL